MGQVKCHVSSCKFNETQLCGLSQIEVGKTSPNPCCAAETECDSFQAE